MNLHGGRLMKDDIFNVHKIDCTYELENGAYDEAGDISYCEVCGEEMEWDPLNSEWVCWNCKSTMDRRRYFEYIGATPPGDECYSCDENYPYCKKYCMHYEIDEDDPMMQ